MMLAAQALLLVFALSFVVVAAIVAIRLARCAYRALRAGRVGYAALSLLGIACIAALLAAVAGVWFAYAVAHSEKDLWTDLRTVLLTGIPFHGAAFALWRAGRHVETRIESVASGATGLRINA